MVMENFYFSSDKPQAYAHQLVDSTLRRIQPTLILMILLLASIKVFSQTLGDYRSVNPGGPWTNLNSWQYYDGSSWVVATTYPGQNATGTGNVLIQSGHSITIGTTGINTGVIGSITITGNLTLTGINTAGTGTDYIFNTPLITVTPLQGTITFINKVNLKLPGNAVLSVTSDTTPNPDYYGLIGDCNHNQDIYIGTSVYAYCNGAGENGLTFDDVMNGSGTLNAIPSSNSPLCEGNQINLFGNYSGITGATVSYSWAIVAPGGGNSNSTLQNPTILNAIAGTYNITLTCTTTYKGNPYSNYETFFVLVNPRPGTISIGTITQPTCSTSSGSVILNNLPTGNWTINPGAISGSGTSTTINGLSPGTYNFTVTNNNGCISNPSSNVVISPPGKTWNGSSSSNWFTASNWTPSVVPTSTDCVTINNSGISPIISGPTIAYAYSLTILGGGNLQIASSSSLQVTDFVNVNPSGVFTIKNSGSLVQVNNVVNTGNINMERTAFIDFRDYVYWSTPVNNFSSSNLSSFSNNSNLYKWIPTVVGNGIGNFGTWTNGTETMVLGKGYIERGLNNAPLNSPVNFTATFTGIPNNGNISTPISRGDYIGDSYWTPIISPTEATMDDDNWNLLGNPYPSSISANAFLTANQDNLDGFVKIWTHGTAPNTSNQDPFYGNFGYNYDVNDYITWNLSGSTIPGFTGYIAAGQGFFTKMLDTNTGNNAFFDNSMRNTSYTNNEFFKTRISQKANSNEEGRIWLDLVSPTASTTALIAYMNNATNERDKLYDATADLKSNFRINSLLNYERLLIQGKKTPFNQEDIINLAINIPTSGSYTIAINSVDGLFFNEEQNIFLEDNQLNIIHNLRSSPYEFVASQGENINRFTLRYTNQTLSNNDLDYNNSVSVYTNENINIKSFSENITSVKVYDLLGKTLFYQDKIYQKEITLENFKPTSNLVIVKIILNKGKEIVKKIIY